MEQNKNNENNYYLFDDNYIDLYSNEDLVGNLLYVDELEKIICDSTSNNNIETIALIGRWGAGKSSVVKSLETRIKEKRINEKKVRFIWYNAWKFNNDSFRKTFLINSTENEKEREKLEKKLYVKETITDYGIDKKIIRYILAVIIVIVLFIVVYYICTGEYSDLAKWIPDLILKIVGISAVQSVSSILLKKIFVEKKVTSEREFSPNDFSENYEEIMKNNKCYSVIVIDDLDRCDSDQTLEILDTIKGYLKTNCINNIFIIPIDKNRLEKILKSQREYDKNDTAEYLSKVFDITIDLKEPGNLNLYTMVENVSHRYNFGLSNYSISILCDYLIKTPRDVKKHLNNIRIKFSIMKNQKKCGYINSNSFIEDNFNDFVKFYIIESRWPEWYGELIRKFNMINTSNVEKILNIVTTEDHELKSFLTVTQFVTFQNILAYNNLKDDEVKSNIEIIDCILINDISKAIEIANHNIQELVENFEYAYKKYIIGRKLESQYLAEMLNCYFYIINNYDEGAKLLENSIIRFKDINLKMKSVFDFFRNNNILDKKIGIFINEVNRYAERDEVMVEFLEFNSMLIEILISTREIDLLMRCINRPNLCAKNKLDTTMYIDAIAALINNCEINNISFVGMFSNSTFEMFGDQRIELLKLALENKCFSFIYEVLVINPCIDDIPIVNFLSKLDVVNKLSTGYDSITSETVKHDLIELKVLNLLFTRFSETVWDFLKGIITFNYISRLVNSVEKVEVENVTLLNELSQFYYHVINANNDIVPFETFYNSLDILNHRDTIDYILNMSLEVTIINELYIEKLNDNNGLDLLDNYIKFLTKCDNVSLLNCWLRLQSGKTNVSILLNSIKKSVSFNYVNYIQYILPCLLTLSQKYIEKIFANLSFDVIASPIVMEKLSGLNKNNIILLDLIKRVDTIEDYKKMLSIMKKYGKAKSAYHQAMEKIVNNVKNVDDLLAIHHDTEICIDITDLNIIKNKVEKSYPQHKEKFNLISWKY